MEWDEWGGVGVARSAAIVGIAGIAGIGHRRGRRCHTSLPNPLKPTPIWDHLGCSGIPREGVGAARSAAIARNRAESPESDTAEGGGATRAYLKPTAIWDRPGTPS